MPTGILTLLRPLRCKAVSYTHLAPIPVTLGTAETVQPVLEGSDSFVIEKTRAGDMQTAFDLPETLTAPIQAGQRLGEMTVSAGGETVSVSYTHLDVYKRQWQQRVVRLYDPDWHMIEVGESMEHIALRLLDEGYSVEETAALIHHPTDFVEQRCV